MESWQDLIAGEALCLQHSFQDLGSFQSRAAVLRPERMLLAPCVLSCNSSYRNGHSGREQVGYHVTPLPVEPRPSLFPPVDSKGRIYQERFHLRPICRVLPDKPRRESCQSCSSGARQPRLSHAVLSNLSEPEQRSSVLSSARN